MPISRKRKIGKPRKGKGVAGISQRGYSMKAFRRRGQQIAPEDMVRLILRCARARGSQAVLRAARSRRDPFILDTLTAESQRLGLYP